MDPNAQGHGVNSAALCNVDEICAYLQSYVATFRDGAESVGAEFRVRPRNYPTAWHAELIMPFNLEDAPAK